MNTQEQQLRPTLARIDLDALRHNAGTLVERLGPGRPGVLAAVKADAYGHGLVPVARSLVSAGVDQLGVAIVEEGLALREAGVRVPVLVLGGVIHGSEEAAVDAGLTPVLFRPESACRLSAIGERRGAPVAVHLKVDTGMNRLGVPMRELGQFLDLLDSLGGLVVDGVMTHLAEAEMPSSEPTRAQFSAFDQAIAAIRSRGHRPRWTHAANSAALLTGHGTRPVGANLVRPGIMLYGCMPASGCGSDWGLRPVMSFVTRVAFLKSVPAGERLSYGGIFTTARASRIATLPVGYGDGYARALGNRASVLIRGRRAAVVGRVCMDLCLADVTDIPGVAEGDEVTLIGLDGDAQIGAEELAGHLGTIPYEVLCSVSPRVPRTYIGGEE